jgi:glycerol uptake facilitator protein
VTFLDIVASSKGHAGSIFLPEVIGTGLLVLLGCGVVAAVLLNHSKAQNSGWIVITFGWGFAVMVGVGATASFSGGHLNPAVTLGFWADGGFTSDYAKHIPSYIAGQFIGAFIGACIVYAAYLVHWEPTEDPGLKLAVFSTGPAIRNPMANLVTEIIGTFVLVFGVTTALSNGLATAGLFPVVVAFLVVGIGLSLGGPTGYAINPARDLGPRIAHAVLPIPGKGGSDWEYSWIPVVGPVIGGTLGGILHHALFNV